jgi:hypothetical protein
VVVRACTYDPDGQRCAERKLTLTDDVVVDLTLAASPR